MKRFYILNNNEFLITQKIIKRFINDLLNSMDHQWTINGSLIDYQ